ncbi:MAG: hypothetical protein E6249_00630 [Peptoniphilus grossensis]|uniref:hypothetical protein n=1 Tax=Peptoniphilus grossensis TaxID=1465756 RepID=UPI00258AEBC2|nr:hypothetical protein [Peptoniphilus grossensis]MDU3009943.1 hypothetical protein [Peptoniphilus harei]MDU5098956.1 hypothetical protein [Peptoniphilus grossensis]
MKRKILSSIYLTSCYLGILTLLVMLISVLPGMIRGKLFIDNDTLVRFSIVLLFLLILAYLVVLSISGNERKILLKITNYISIFLYIFFIFFILLRSLNNNYPTVNMIPFKSIINYVYDFLTLTGKLNYFSFLKFIIFPIVYLIPVFIFIKTKYHRNYYIFISIIIISLEVVKFFLYKSFNLDNILLGLLSAIITAEVICKIPFKLNLVGFNDKKVL